MTNFHNSGFARSPFDAYYTEHWCTEALLRSPVAELLIEDVDTEVWEPCAGRGDIAVVMEDALLPISCFDIDLVEPLPDLAAKIIQKDFFEASKAPVKGPCTLISNPPYDKAPEFVEHGLKLMRDGQINSMALLLRSAFKHACSKKRLALTKNCPEYAHEVVLTARPRWDWWLPAEEIQRRKDEGKWKSPMHVFSWFVWGTNASGEPGQSFEGRS